MTLKLLAFIITAASCFAQATSYLPILPATSSASPATGYIGFRELRSNGSNEVQIAAPNALASSYKLVLPDSLPPSGGAALIFSAAGVGSWTSSGMFVTVGGAQPSIGGEKGWTALHDFGVGLTVSAAWKHLVAGGGSANIYTLSSSGGSQQELSVSNLGPTQTQWVFRGSLMPFHVSGNNGDIGTSSSKWRDAYFSGTIYTDSLNATNSITTNIFSANEFRAPASGGFYISTGATDYVSLTSGLLDFNTGTGSQQRVSLGGFDGMGPIVSWGGRLRLYKIDGTTTKAGIGHLDNAQWESINGYSVGGSSLADGSRNVTANNLSVGGLVGSHLEPSISGTYDVGSPSRPWNVVRSLVANSEYIEVALPGSSHGTFWRHRLNGASTYRLDSGSGAQTELQVQVIGSNTTWGFNGSLFPLSLTGTNGTIGNSVNKWREGYFSGLVSAGSLTATSANITNLTVSSCSGCGSITNYVNTTGNQGSIAGNKDWLGLHTFFGGTTFARNFNPIVDSTYWLGNASFRWANLYTNAAVIGNPSLSHLKFTYLGSAMTSQWIGSTGNLDVYISAGAGGAPPVVRVNNTGAFRAEMSGLTGFDTILPYRANGVNGITQVLSVRNASDTGSCTITISLGVPIASTC